MFLKKVDGKRAVRLSNGEVLSQADLPPEGTVRWVASRKEKVVRAVDCGLITRENALKRWALSDEEFDQWRAAFHRHGAAALKVTRLQAYRQP